MIIDYLSHMESGSDSVCVILTWYASCQSSESFTHHCVTHTQTHTHSTGRKRFLDSLEIFLNPTLVIDSAQLEFVITETEKLTSLTQPN